MHFPDSEGENLAGDELAFPRDFGARTIALVAFDLKARDDLESWVPFVDRFARAGRINGRVFPVLSRSMRMMKGMILTALRKTAPAEPEVHAATVPLFVDLDDFCAALGISDRSAIHILVIEPDGAVLEHHTGPYSQLVAAVIETHVDATA
jgi:hypothetical protein